MFARIRIGSAEHMYKYIFVNVKFPCKAFTLVGEIQTAESIDTINATPANGSMLPVNNIAVKKE